MPNCLGIYAENNIIKYAKLDADKNGGSLKLASYGVRFSENTRATIEAIINETNSFDDNVATNIVGEKYEIKKNRTNYYPCNYFFNPYIYFFSSKTTKQRVSF